MRPGLVAIDGTKLNANASRDASRTAEQIAAEILAEAAATDAAEDTEADTAGRHADGDSDGGLRTRSGRRARLRALLDSCSPRRSPTSAPAYAPMITAAKRNLKAAGERRRVRRVVADAGYWSVDTVAIKGVASFIAPGRAGQLKKIAETEQARTAILDRVEAGEIDTLDASEQLGVSRARVNQLLRRRRAGDPDPLTTTMIAKLDSPRGRKTYKQRAPSIEPVFAQIKTQPTHPNRLSTGPDRRGQ